MSVVSTISITTIIVIMIGRMVITDMICAVVIDVHQCCIYTSVALHSLVLGKNVCVRTYVIFTWQQVFYVCSCSILLHIAIILHHR